MVCAAAGTAPGWSSAAVVAGSSPMARRNVWSDQGSLKRELRACGVREVYWRQPVSHDEMIGRPAAVESGFGLRMPLLADI
ncbi:DUF6482 family protein [Stutzerimonas kunmingensis]|uniref:DUF6482 family protein n=2 Tax=Stutzerimonas kunmingensis TaxID=1211807 RepID=UPI00301523DC